MNEYKHLGKPVTFTLRLFIYGELTREETVTVKPNSFSLVIFDLSLTPEEPVPPPESPPTKPPRPPRK